MTYLQKAVHILLATIYAVGAFHAYSHYGFLGLVLYLAALFALVWAINRLLDWRDSRFRLPGL